jgi:hypothetical protein
MKFITTYHPHSNGNIERVNQVIEDMLIMHVIDKPSKWEDYLHLVEFSFNNGYQDSLNMIPFEAQYAKKCNTPMTWDNPTNKVVLELEFLKDIEDQMVKIKENLKAVQDRKKSYENKNMTTR